MHIDLAIPSDEIRRGLASAARVIPPPDLLDGDLRRRIEAQEQLLRWAVASVCAAVDAPLAAAIRAEHHVIPPGWWFAPAELGFADAAGRVSMIACGIEGVPLGYRTGADADHRRQGIDAVSWAVICTHEAAHAAHALVVGFPAMAAALVDPARKPGAEVEGFGSFAAHLHKRITGVALPSGFNADRWPWRAPGLDGWLEGLPAAIAPFAVAPASPECPCDEATWLDVQRASLNADLRNLFAEREAAARWRAGAGEATP